MKKNYIIENTITEASVIFRRSLIEFYPAYGTNGFNERNLTFQFAHAFANRPCSYAFFEIPFFNKENNKHDKHIDGYVFDNEIGIFIESKRLYNADKAEAVSKDILKMNKKNIKYILENCHENRLPKNIYTLVLMESWKKDINSWWIDGKNEKIEWDDKDFPDEMVYGSIKVNNWDDDSEIHWLYGYKRLEM